MSGTITEWGAPTKGKVLSVVPKTKDGQQEKDTKFGTYKSIVEIEGVTVKYIVSTKDPEASSWAVGQEVEYKTKKWTSDDGTYEMHFASLVKQDMGFPGKKSYPSKGIKQYKAEAVINAMTAASNIVSIKDGVTEKEYPNYFNAIYKSAELVLNQIFGEQ